MAKFEHSRYPAIELQGESDKWPWAKFTPEKRTFGEHTIKVGVLETDDEKVIARLRKAIDTGRDQNLKEVDPPKRQEPAGDDLDGLDKDALLAVAENEDVKVDKRWGDEKIATAIRENRQ